MLKCVETYLENLNKGKEIEEKINKHEKSIQRLEKRKGKINTYWVDIIIKPLASELASKLNKKHFVIYGPFGLRCQTTIYLIDDETKNILSQSTYSLSLVPGNLCEGIVYYETGNVTKQYPEGSIAAMNEMGNEVKELPDNIDKIIKLLTFTERG